MRYRIAFAVAAAVMSGCASITSMDGSPIDAWRSSSACTVSVYQTYQAAIAAGPIVELCVINGSASMSFDKSIAGTIDRHKIKACDCGARDAYVQHRTGGDFFTDTTVSMVAFKRAK